MNPGYSLLGDYPELALSKQKFRCLFYNFSSSMSKFAGSNSRSCFFARVK